MTPPPAAKSPYRAASAKITAEFLEFLSSAQSELTEAAKENNWEVDFDTMSKLDTQAAAAIEKNRLDQCVAQRARAIDSLMRELYAKTRR